MPFPQRLISFSQKLAKFVIGITLIIVMHEAGHTIAAKLCGVKIEKFSIGFGPGYTIQNVPVVNELTLSPILLGGYVEFDTVYFYRGNVGKPIVWLCDFGCVEKKASRTVFIFLR